MTIISNIKDRLNKWLIFYLRSVGFVTITTEEHSELVKPCKCKDGITEYWISDHHANEIKRMIKFLEGVDEEEEGIKPDPVLSTTEIATRINTLISLVENKSYKKGELAKTLTPAQKKYLEDLNGKTMDGDVINPISNA